MTFRACITGKAGKDRAAKQRADEAASLFEELEGDARGRMNGPEAASYAAEETQRALRVEAARKKRTQMLSALAADRIRRNLLDYRDGRGRVNPGAAAEALLARDELAPYSNVEGRRDAIRSQAFAGMEEMLARFKRTGGVARTGQQKAGLKNIVRELFGTETGDAGAREMAQAWAATADGLRLRYNAAGGAIAKLENWGLPQVHDTLKVRAASFEDWRAFILPRLDREKMIDRRTGAPFSPEALEFALRDVYESIKSRGFDDFQPSMQLGGRALGNRRQDSRFLVFRDADAWLDYQGRFGEADPLDVMIGHVEGMSRDIALMEILGPNPTAMLNFVKGTVRKMANDAFGEAGRFDGQLNRMDRIFDLLTGAANSPAGPGAEKLAAVAGTLRNVQTAALLGSASLSAISDWGFQAVTARMSDLPVTRVIKRQLSLMNPASEADRRLADRLGLVANNAAITGVNQARFLGEVYGPEWSRRLASGVLWASGLDAWTAAGREAFAWEFAGFLADMADRAFADIEPGMRRTLEKRGITSMDWDQYRRHAAFEERGHRFLAPREFLRNSDLPGPQKQAIADKFIETVQQELDFAVPTSSLRGRATVLAGRKGSFVRELADSTLLFKSFGISILFNHGRRFLLQKGAWNKAAYLGQIVVLSTLLGGAAVQLKGLARGRDPQPMTTPKFWGAALLQGGGLGIFGDFFFSDQNRFGGGLAETAAGPIVSLMSDVAGLTIGNVQQLVQGDETNFGRELVRFAGRNTPGASLWYTRLALERSVIDRLDEVADPAGINRRRRAYRRRLQREQGTDFYWAPGEAAPDHAPDFGNILEVPR